MHEFNCNYTVKYKYLYLTAGRREALPEVFPKNTPPITQNPLDSGVWALSKLFAHSCDFQMVFIAPISLIFRGMGMELGSLSPWHCSALSHIAPATRKNSNSQTIPQILESWSALGGEGS